jgi:PAS domain S-box-containing protein
MGRKLLDGLGKTGTVVLLTLFIAATSCSLYVIFGGVIGQVAMEGIVFSFVVPLIVAPVGVLALIRGSDQLDTTREELRKANTALEARVKERTAELVQVNAELEAEIAERQLIERTLRESEERYRAVVEQAEEGIVLYDISSRQVLEANPAYCRLLGYSCEEMLERTLYDIVAHDRESIDRNLDRIVRKGYHFIGQRQHRRKDGMLVEVEVNVNCVTYGGAEVMCVLVRDITARKRAEAAMRRQSERLGILHEIDQAILTAQSPQAIAQVALEHLCRQLGCELGSVAAFDLESDRAFVLATCVDGDTQLQAGLHLPLESFGLKGLPEGQSRVVEDLSSLGQQTSTDRVLYEEGIRSYVNVPLIAQGQLKGSLNLGHRERRRLGGDDLEIAQEVAGSLAIALQQAHMREQLQLNTKNLERSALDLSRTNAFVTALSQVTIRLETAPDPQQVMRTLGEELKPLGMDCIIALLEPDGQSLLIRYTSLESAILQAGEKILGTGMIGYPIQRNRFPIWDDVFVERRAVVLADVASIMMPVLPGFLKRTIKQVMRLGGLRPDTKAVWLPLSVGQRLIGGLCVWGPDLQDEDTVPLTVFGGQVAIALENARLYAAERQRTEDLARTSAELKKELGERRRAETELQRYAAELEQRNEELQQFAYVASHDLQEPLRMVVSYLQLLERRYKNRLDEDAQEFINFAVEGATRMHELIRGLLAYSRIGRDGRVLESTDTQVVLDRALANLEVTIAENDAIVTSGALPTIKADASQMEQLFQNLIGNALKFRGGSQPQIHVESKKQEDGWLFSVQDNGIGIDPQYADRIFVIFQRLHTRDEYPGTGIGLAICRRIVERHDGRIWLDSEPGRGSTFFFTILDGR